MADILVKHNQAETDLQSWANLKARHIGFSEESRGFWFKLDDGSDAGLPLFVPTTIGQGAGRRVTRAAHGFSAGQAVRLVKVSGLPRWLLASASAVTDTLATHLVVRVVSADEFDVATVGAWSLGGAPLGAYYLSTTPGALTPTRPTGVIAQKVAIGDGVSYHLGFELDQRITVSTGAPSGTPADGDIWFQVPA